jgi:hypothetical protein
MEHDPKLDHCASTRLFMVTRATIHHIGKLAMLATSIAESAASFSSMPTPAFSQMVSVKLNQENYLLWAAQVLPYLRSQGLSGHIDGSIAMPRQTIAAASAEDSGGRTIVVNPDYTSWYHQDQLVLSVINSSLSEEVLSTVVDATTARHA